MTDQPDQPTTTDQPDARAIVYGPGPTRAVVTLLEYEPPALIFIDIDGHALATPGVSAERFEAVRLALTSALGPYRTNPPVNELPTPGLPRHASDDDADREDSQERGKSKDKGKGKKKGHDKQKGKKGRPDWAGNPEHPDHPSNRPVEPEAPEAEIPVDNTPADTIPTDAEVAAALAGLDLDADPVAGDVDLRKPHVVVNAAVTLDPAAFADWYADKFATDTDQAPDPALHPTLVADYLADTQ